MQISLLNKILHFPRLLWKRFGKNQVYISEKELNSPWIFVSYIPWVFYTKPDVVSHQNQQEQLKMVEVFNNVGYNVIVMAFDTLKPLPDINPEIVFGIGPLFEKACKKYSNAYKVYYATGAYHEHQTNMVKKMTDEFNHTFKSSIPYRRMGLILNCPQLADSILQIGTKYTTETYPQEVRRKIHLIHQSTQSQKVLQQIDYAKENEFVFMGSSGNALKGVGLLVSYFSKHPSHKIHIIGPIEDDVREAITPYLTPNIILHGFMNVNSDEFLSIVKRCNFTVYPSGSEGGAPGAVISLMKNGLIPIYSKWAAVEDLNNVGFMLDNIDEESLDKALLWADRLTKYQVVEMKRTGADYVSRTFNLERYSSELEDYIKTIATK